MAAEKHDPEFTLTILDKISLNQFAYMYTETLHTTHKHSTFFTARNVIIFDLSVFAFLSTVMTMHYTIFLVEGLCTKAGH